MSKPSTLPRIASAALSNILRVVQPPLAQREQGFDPGQLLPAQWLNWAIGWLTEWAVYLDGLESEALQWLVAQRFDGASGDANDVLWGEPAVTTRRSILRFRTFTGVYWRLYSLNGGGASGSAVELAINAAWQPGSSVWQHDVNTAPAYLLRLRAETSYGVEIRVRAAGAGTWADGAWSRTAMLDALISGLAVDGNFQANDAFFSGEVQFGGDVSIVDDHDLSVEGSIDAGGSIATAGDLDATSSTSFVRSARLRLDRGTAFSTGDFTLSAGWGATATVAAVHGSYGASGQGSATDARGVIVVSAAGAGIALPQTITANWKNGAWSTAPMVKWSYRDIGAAGVVALNQSTASVLSMSVAAVALAAGSHIFTYEVTG